jgi:GNAT superfamily N-acetyltransferase
MTKKTPVFRVATAGDAALLCSFAERTFRATFGPDNTAEDMDAYCAATFTPALHERALAVAENHFIVAEHAGALAAYAQLRDGPAPPCVIGSRPIEILRFYVDAPWHGTGLARALMAETLTAATARAARTVFLAVWEKNPRAAAFYRKEGFRDVGSRMFVLGSDVQTDLLMVRQLTV